MLNPSAMEIFERTVSKRVVTQRAIGDNIIEVTK